MVVLHMALLSVFLTGSAWWDLRTGKVPNLWIALGAVSYVTLQFASQFTSQHALQYVSQYIRGPSGGCRVFAAGAAAFLARAALFTALFFLLYLFRMMGAGDIKVMALIGGYLGISEGLSAIFYGLAASAAWSFLSMIHRGILKKRIRYFYDYLRRSMKSGTIGPYYRPERDRNEAGFCLIPFLWCGFFIWMAGQGGIR